MDIANLPLAWANYLSMLIFLGLLVLVWSIPKKSLQEDAPDQSRWRDIRLWATALIGIQLLVYAVFN